MRIQLLIVVVLVFTSIVSAKWKKKWNKKKPKFLGTGYPNITIAEIKQAGMDIYERINSTLDGDGVKVLIPGIIRLGFHECIDKCDGCINLRQPSNRKLDFTVNHLEDVYMNKKWNARMSRADFWALASKMAVEAGVYQNNHVKCNGSTEYKKPDSCSTYPIFIKVYLGRKDCPTSPDQTNIVPMPSPFSSNTELKEFFKKNFNMNRNGAVAMMGAHTVGRAGGIFHGIWDPDNIDGITNSYYHTVAVRNNKKNPFIQEEVSNITGADHPVYQFRRANNNKFALVADAALILSLPLVNKTTGYDGCRDFNDTTRPASCGRAKGTVGMTSEYARSPRGWALHFGVRYTRTLINGYNSHELAELDNFFVLDFGDIYPFNMVGKKKIEKMNEIQKQQLEDLSEEMKGFQKLLDPATIKEMLKFQKNETAI